jgi:CheY-like chemotaxis protein
MPGRIPERVYRQGGARMATQILIADDDPTIRLLLRRLLEKQGDWQVCGEASNGVEAIEGVERFKPPTRGFPCC